TPAYMAPEQLSGLGADARSDQFSYCVALYEGLFGQRPYPGTTIAALLDSIEHGRFCSPPASAGVPRWVTQALRRGLDPEPTRRHRDMAALRLALDPARPRRQRTVATIALAAALPLGVAAWASQQPPDTACQDARERAETAWSDDDREALAHAFTRLDPPRRGPILATAVRHLDARTATWTAAYSRACDANRRGVAPPRTDQQLQCLQTVLHETQTAVDRLIDAAPEGLMRADTVVRGLTAVDDCQDPRALDRRLWANADPAAAAPIQQLRRDIAKARIRLAVDQDIQDAVEDYQELNARAATLGALAQRLQTANVVGRLLHIQGRSEEAAQILEPNYFAAHEANDVTESYEAAAQLVQVYGHGLGALEPAL
nr:protein kinase [Deltaproteobacteria bacterium]